MPTEVRPGNKTLETVLKTDELHGHDVPLAGPRGRDYGVMLPNPKPWQQREPYPDPNSSYWFTVLEMPAGKRAGRCEASSAHCRYMQFALYRDDPDMGSVHRDRRDDRSTIRSSRTRLGEPVRPRRDRAGREPRLHAPDRQRGHPRGPDGSRAEHDVRGDPAPSGRSSTASTCPTRATSATRAWGSRPTRRRSPTGPSSRPRRSWTSRCVHFRREPLPGMSVEHGGALCSAPDNDPELQPETTPAREPALLERYFSNDWNLVAVFKTPEARAKVPSKVETGFGGDPGIVYLMGFVSQGFGPVLVIRGKMPQYPDNYYGENGEGLDVMTDWQSRYMSLIMTQAPPSGMGTDGISDFQVPLDEDRNYTIAISRPENRPANATDEHGVAWLDWGTEGEGIDDRANRTDFGMLVFRFMYNNPDWEHDPGEIVEHGTEEEIMGPYFPRLSYTDKATFEAGDA